MGIIIYVLYYIRIFFKTTNEQKVEKGRSRNIEIIQNEDIIQGIQSIAINPSATYHRCMIF